MNQRTIADDTLHTSLHQNSTSPIFTSELSISLVDFEELLTIWLFCRSECTKYYDAKISCFGLLLELHDSIHSFVSVFDKH